MLHNKKPFFALLSSLALAAVSVTPVHAAVVASVKPLGFIAAAIAEGVTPVEVLLPDGASEHDYSLRPSDLQRLRSADLVVWVGPEMEAFMPKVVASLPAGKSVEIASLPTVKPLLLRGQDDDKDEGETAAAGHEESVHHHHHGEYNMHLWLSPDIAMQSAVAIHEKLLELMPQSKDKLDANLRDFQAELASTDTQIRNQLAPVKEKGYFVFHDAYTYFEKHFGLIPTGYFTVNPVIQPGVQRVNQIRTQLVEQKAVCVFAEPQFRPAVIKDFADKSGVRAGTLDPLGTEITVSKDSYVEFLSQLSSQYTSCLKGD